MSEYKLMQEERSLPVSRRYYDTLKDQIRQTESNLFQMKAELVRSCRLTGKHKLAMPNLYNCRTCHNHTCLHNIAVEDAHPSNRYMLVAIHNQTILNGCLEWLPEEP